MYRYTMRNHIHPIYPALPGGCQGGGCGECAPVHYETEEAEEEASVSRCAMSKQRHPVLPTPPGGWLYVHSIP